MLPANHWERWTAHAVQYSAVVARIVMVHASQVIINSGEEKEEKEDKMRSAAGGFGSA